MPHERNLRRILSKYSVDHTNYDNNKRYLQYKISRLSEREKKCVLMIDEIHVRAMVSCDINYGAYVFDIDSDHMAHTVLAFMIKSIFRGLNGFSGMIIKFYLYISDNPN